MKNWKNVVLAAIIFVILSSSAQLTSATSIVPEGIRAMTIRVANSHAFVRGDSVDVLVKTPSEVVASRTDKTVRLLLRNVPVLAIGHPAENSIRNSATLLVTPYEAEKKCASISRQPI